MRLEPTAGWAFAISSRFADGWRRLRRCRSGLNPTQVCRKWLVAWRCTKRLRWNSQLRRRSLLRRARRFWADVAARRRSSFARWRNNLPYRKRRARQFPKYSGFTDSLVCDGMWMMLRIHRRLCHGGWHCFPGSGHHRDGLARRHQKCFTLVGSPSTRENSSVRSQFPVIGSRITRAQVHRAGCYS